MTEIWIQRSRFLASVANYLISEGASEGQAGGHTEEDVINLSYEEDDEDEVQAGKKGSLLVQTVDLENNPDVLKDNGTLPHCKKYKIRHAALELGCEIASYQVP